VEHVASNLVYRRYDNVHRARSACRQHSESLMWNKHSAKWYWQWIVSPILGGVLIAGGCAMGNQHDDSPVGPTPGGKIVVTCDNGSQRSDCKLS
jgi:hypothetical protein